ncbi:unnamed protein product [Prunus armeniaca]
MTPDGRVTCVCECDLRVFAKAIFSDLSWQYRRFPAILSRWSDFRQLSPPESPCGSEPNTFNGESSNDHRDTGSEALSFDNGSSEDGEVEVVGKRVNAVSSFGRGKVMPTERAVLLAAVP